MWAVVWEREKKKKRRRETDRQMDTHIHTQ
jgi:hypothetical protein